MRKSDKFQGLVLTVNDNALPESITAPVFEFLFTPIPHPTKISREEDKVWALEVRESIQLSANHKTWPLFFIVGPLYLDFPY